jgi:hypothetical protein
VARLRGTARGLTEQTVDVTDRPETRYATEPEGTHVASQVTGEGPPDPFLVGEFNTPSRRTLGRSNHREALQMPVIVLSVISFDKPGAGLSDPVALNESSSQGNGRSASAVIEAVGSDQAALFRTADGPGMRRVLQRPRA